MTDQQKAASRIVQTLFSYAGIHTETAGITGFNRIKLSFAPGYFPGIGTGETNYRPLAS